MPVSLLVGQGRRRVKGLGGLLHISLLQLFRPEGHAAQPGRSSSADEGRVLTPPSLALPWLAMMVGRESLCMVLPGSPHRLVFLNLNRSKTSFLSLILNSWDLVILITA